MMAAAEAVGWDKGGEGHWAMTNDLCHSTSIAMLLRIVGFLLLFLSIAHPDAVKPADIYVVHGDTIEALGKRIRLVGFDAPELGGHAHCGLERMLAARASSRLRQMIRNSDDVDLQIVDCSCRPGTEGTMACN
jgi:endonuclease YncB( thermonuclease family)